MNALQAVSVSKIYGDGAGAVRAVDEVSFTVKAGQFVALLGPSGSGKTTMLAMMAGLLRPSGGNIMIGGQELTNMGDRQRTIPCQFHRLCLSIEQLDPLFDCVGKCRVDAASEWQTRP